MATDPGVSGNGWRADPVSSGDPTSGGFGGTVAGGGWGDPGNKAGGGKSSTSGTTIAGWVAGILTAVLTGSLPAGIAIGRLTTKGLNAAQAQGLINLAVSGEQTPIAIGQLAAKEWSGTKTITTPITKEEAVQGWIEAQKGSSVLGPDRLGVENTIKDFMAGGDRSTREDQNIQSIVKGLKNPHKTTTVNTFNGFGETNTSPTDQEPEIPALPPTDIEKEISSLQLATAREFRDKINDPRIMEDIYKSLPATKMSKEDRAKFTEEYADIKKRVTAVGMEQQNKAMGQKLDDLVSRGVISQESADKQRMKNEAAVNTVIKIYNKKLDSARIGIAKEQFNSDSGLKMYGAGVIADVDNRNRQIYSNVVSQALNNLERKRSAQYNYASDAANASLRNKAIRSETDIDIGNSLAETLAPMAGKALRNAT